jgi:hypothetical protein
MSYRFKNGIATMKHRVSPNGTREIVIHLTPDGDKLDDLYQEVSAFVKTEANVEHTILLMKHTDAPYMVAFKAEGYW